MEFILQPWAWYASGPLIALSMFLMYYFGRSLGISSNLESLCSMTGAGKLVEYFKFDWRKKKWNLIFMLGLILGGFLSSNYLSSTNTVAISQQTKTELNDLGFKNAGDTYMPTEIFNVENLNIKTIAILLIAGFLVGFGARYAGGCTSGHAIVGLSMLQMPSLISVIGFFIGGLTMTWLIYPLIFN